MNHFCFWFWTASIAMLKFYATFFEIFKHRALLISAMAYPFRVNFLSDVYESTAAAIDEGGLTGTVKQVGFKLNYFQTAC